MGSPFLSLWGSLCEGDNEKLFRLLLEHVSLTYHVHFGSTIERGVAGVKLRVPGLKGARENFAIAK